MLDDLLALRVRDHVTSYTRDAHVVHFNVAASSMVVILTWYVRAYFET